MKSGMNTTLNPARRSAKVLEFEAALRRKIVGQDSAILRMTEAYQIFLAGLSPALVG